MESQTQRQGDTHHPPVELSLWKVWLMVFVFCDGVTSTSNYSALRDVTLWLRDATPINSHKDLSKWGTISTRGRGRRIHKRPNWLKGGIFEVLQILKSLFKAKDMFRMPLAPADEVEEVKEVENNTYSGERWDCILGENPNNYGPDKPVD
ncbi:hypothetical protein B0H14DRAFT_2564901 [Mycena olivaceomarginata]|nr:hypothetical protein B0H14DRAFT_2564901 [Mycena olivaceomarginata]